MTDRVDKSGSCEGGDDTEKYLKIVMGMFDAIWDAADDIRKGNLSQAKQYLTEVVQQLRDKVIPVESWTEAMTRTIDTALENFPSIFKNKGIDDRELHEMLQAISSLAHNYSASISLNDTMSRTIANILQKPTENSGQSPNVVYQEADTLLKKCLTDLETNSFSIDGRPLEIIAEILQANLNKFHKDYLVGEKMQFIDWKRDWLEGFQTQLVAIRRLVEMNADFVGKKALLEQIETINNDINFLLNELERKNGSE